VIRRALLYALADGERHISTEHLTAALAPWALDPRHEEQRQATPGAARPLMNGTPSSGRWTAGATRRACKHVPAHPICRRGSSSPAPHASLNVSRNAH
jgi:hypothetical protein